MNASLNERLAVVDWTALHPGNRLRDMQKTLEQAGLDQYRARWDHVARYGFVLLPSEVLDMLALQLKGLKVLEVGAGTGTLARELTLRGVDIVACDPRQGWERYGFVWHHEPMIVGDGLQLLPGDFDAVIMTWPCHGKPWAHEVAQAMRPGQLLFYEGEWKGGCTADDSFFDEVEHWEWVKDQGRALNQYHIGWEGMHDDWWVFCKT